MFAKFNVTEDHAKMQYLTTGNKSVFGKPGVGIKVHPWDCLKPCQCGNKYPWMHGFPKTPPYNEIVEPDLEYQIVCHKCLCHTHKATYEKVVEEWNGKIDPQSIDNPERNPERGKER